MKKWFYKFELLYPLLLSEKIFDVEIKEFHAEYDGIQKVL